MSKCKHYNYDDYFEKCLDCNLTNLQIIASSETAEEARQHAIDWQDWASDADFSYSELAEYAAVFTELGKKYDLIEEFKENGII